MEEKYDGFLFWTAQMLGLPTLARRVDPVIKESREPETNIETKEFVKVVEEEEEAESNNELQEEIVIPIPSVAQRVIDEITATEKDYVQDLIKLLDFFFRPIHQHEELKKSNPLVTLCTTCESILEIHLDLLSRIMASEQDPSSLVHAFEKCLQYFKIYSTYCTNFKSASRALLKVRRQSPQIRKFLLNLEKNAADEGINIQSSMIKPVQRICKYPLFFRKLLQNATSPEQHQLLTKSLQQIEAISTIVNENVRADQNNRRLFDLRTRLRGTFPELITPTRRFITEMCVRIAKRVPSASSIALKPTEYHLILFSDILLMAKADGFGHLRVKKELNLLSLILHHDTAITSGFDSKCCFELLVVKVPTSRSISIFSRASSINAKKHGEFKQYVVICENPKQKKTLFRDLDENIHHASNDRTIQNNLEKDPGSLECSVWTNLMSEIRSGQKEMVVQVHNRKNIIKGVRNL